MVSIFDVVIDNDGFGQLEPLNNNVESPREVQLKFDWLSYQKGAVILRMLKDAIGEDVFVRGVRNYLEEMQYQSAEPSDLYAGIQKAVDEVKPGGNVNIAEFMDSWTNARGLPVVSVSRTTNGLLFTQSNVGSDENVLFSIPINLAYSSFPNFVNVTADFWLTTKELEVSPADIGINWTDAEWLIVNLRDTGYYLTNYDDALWKLITTTLANDHEAVHFLNRGTLFADVRRFIELDTDFRATIFLELLDLMKLEFHHHVWERASQGLRVFERRLRGSETHALYLNFLRSVMEEIYGRTFDGDFIATNTVNRESCLSGVQACTDDALSALNDELTNGWTDFRYLYRCNAFRAADETVWNQVFDEAISRSHNWEIMRTLRDLECTEDPELIKKLFDVTLDLSIGLSSFDRANIVESLIRANYQGYKAAVDYVEEHHEFINAE